MNESEFNVAVGARIRAMRDEAGFTQAQIGDLLGLGRSSVSNIEAGRQPVSAYALLRISRLLECDLAELLPGQQGRSALDVALAGEHPDVQRFVSDHLVHVR